MSKAKPSGIIIIERFDDDDVRVRYKAALGQEVNTYVLGKH
jgi:hypothetical protein